MLRAARVRRECDKVATLTRCVLCRSPSGAGFFNFLWCVCSWYWDPRAWHPLATLGLFCVYRIEARSGMAIPVLGCTHLSFFRACSVQLLTVLFGKWCVVPNAPYRTQVPSALFAPILMSRNAPRVQAQARTIVLQCAHPDHIQWIHCLCAHWRCAVMPLAHLHIHVVSSLVSVCVH